MTNILKKPKLLIAGLLFLLGSCTDDASPQTCNKPENLRQSTEFNNDSQHTFEFNWDQVPEAMNYIFTLKQEDTTIYNDTTNLTKVEFTSSVPINNSELQATVKTQCSETEESGTSTLAFKAQPTCTPPQELILSGVAIGPEEDTFSFEWTNVIQNSGYQFTAYINGEIDTNVTLEQNENTYNYIPTIPLQESDVIFIEVRTICEDGSTSYPITTRFTIIITDEVVYKGGGAPPQDLCNSTCSFLHFDDDYITNKDGNALQIRNSQRNYSYRIDDDSINKSIQQLCSQNETLDEQELNEFLNEAKKYIVKLPIICF